MGAKVSGLFELKALWEEAVKKIIPEAKKVCGQGSLNIKRDAKRAIRAATHYGYLPHYPKSITYEVTDSGTVVRSEIGPDAAKRQGGLGRLLELGSQNNAPIPHLIPALDREEPKFVRYMGELGVDVMEGRDGPGGPVTDPGE
jgi:hypothetical protein